MIIEQLDSEKVLISLCNEDMQDFALQYDTMNFSDPHSKKILNRLLSLACTKTGMEIYNKTMLVEALPHESGCLILITLVNKKKRKVYKVKHKNHRLCCEFDNSEDFLCAISKLYSIKANYYGNSAYFCDNKYYLIFQYPALPGRVKVILNEFAKQSVCTKTFIARLEENGKLIAQPNAINIIGKPMNA